jgi:hypothetical protein
MNSHGKQSAKQGAKHSAIIHTDSGLNLAKSGHSSFCVHGGAHFMGQGSVEEETHQALATQYRALDAKARMDKVICRPKLVGGGLSPRFISPLDSHCE